ncbi:hyaluronate lyase [Scopulibacillus darangshiensis]|uniref:Hyaluronate lyase n=1 Tax=Scopulibacillus darangshiensis TaxID=442528 RepID=A0A4R2NQ81_9BACL|nr:polysaccharide lyase 8 family protein [Scopulibacillus darangshiensis]TCP23528.1 hyaluronate lyase [Scopulibacillus darangshiensis]
MFFKISARLGFIVLVTVLMIPTLTIYSMNTQNKVYAADEFDSLRMKWKDYLTGGSEYDSGDPDISAYIESLVTSVTNKKGTGFWDTMNRSKERSYLWSDLASKTDPADFTVSYKRLGKMALAYSMKDCSLYQNQKLKKDIVDGMDWLYKNRYNETMSEYGNWWDWEIGTPMALKDLLVLMYNDLTDTQIENNIAVIDRFVPDPTHRTRKIWSTLVETGANRVDKALIVAVRGIVGKDSEKIAIARNALSDVFQYVKDGDGFYRDGSFIQHVDVPYNGSYGIVLMNHLVDVLYALSGSSWKVTDPNLNNVYRWVFDSFEPLIYKGAMMDMVRGRAISRQESSDHSAGRTIITALLKLAEAAPSDVENRIKSMCKYWIQKDTTFENYTKGLTINEMILIKSLMNDTKIKPRDELVTSHVFSSMDRVIHYRPNWALGLSMYSNRISSFEGLNKENLKGWYTGSGMTYLYNNDLTQFSNGFWPTVDSVRLPGTTTDGESKGVTRSPESWVGGTSIDGLYSVAGMSFDYPDSNLRGEKSWFMFDDEIVALGTGITDAENRKVETIVENRKLDKDGDNALIVNGKKKPSQLGWSEKMNHVKWAHLEGNVSNSDIGYYFPGSANLYGLREARTGSWKEINDGGSSDPVTRNYLSLAFEHGVKPENASYAYVLLPNKDAPATKKYSKNPGVRILNNTSTIQAVKEKTLGITAANFFKPGKVSFITADNPASVTVRKEGGVLTLAVADPTQKQDNLTIELDKPELAVLSKDSTVKVKQTSPTIEVKVDVSGSLGKTQVIRFAIDVDHLDESVNFGWEKGWITNQGIFNSLMAKVAHIQDEQNNDKKMLNGLTALENQVRAQSGKHIDEQFSKSLLDDITYLKNQIIS